MWILAVPEEQSEYESEVYLTYSITATYPDSNNTTNDPASDDDTGLSLEVW